MDLVVDDTSDLPYENGSFDSSTIVAALNHIPNRRQVLREVRDGLRQSVKETVAPCAAFADAKLDG